MLGLLYGLANVEVCIKYLEWWIVFFFKQKTAYEMRISDWSSDVCSSDLPARAGHRRGRVAVRGGPHPGCVRGHAPRVLAERPAPAHADGRGDRRRDRKSVV